MESAVVGGINTEAAGTVGDFDKIRVGGDGGSSDKRALLCSVLCPKGLCHFSRDRPWIQNCDKSTRLFEIHGRLENIAEGL